MLEDTDVKIKTQEIGGEVNRIRRSFHKFHDSNNKYYRENKRQVRKFQIKYSRKFPRTQRIQFLVQRSCYRLNCVLPKDVEVLSLRI